jgi:acetyl esterase/lipase
MAIIFDKDLALSAIKQPQFDYRKLDEVRRTMRRNIEVAEMAGFWKRHDPAVTWADHLVPGSQISVRVYGRTDRRTDMSPSIVFLHGGGFMVGDLDFEHPRCLEMCRETRAVVISVNYRLAPEHPYPAALNDCDDVIGWLFSYGADWGLDPARIAIVGCSAGGCLATAALLRRRDRGDVLPIFQLLIYPVLDDRMTAPSVQSAITTPVWNRESTSTMWRCYLGPVAQSAAVSPYAAPARADSVAGLPPSYIVTAEHDPLRDEGIEFAHRLLCAGVPTELHQFCGAFHGFDTLSNSSVSRRAREEQYAILRSAFEAT